jgi:prepilin-type N-terminal cleavage/methylation domain-containing protein
MKTLLRPPTGGGDPLPSIDGRAGFNLIELLVVMAMIGIMAALLVPALAKAKRQATAAACLGNQKQLAAAFHMYAQDNGDRVVQMADYSTGEQLYPAGGFWSGPMPGPNWDSANAAFAAAEKGLRSSNALYYYCNTLGVYHCPGDPRVSQNPTLAGPNGWAYDSYSRTENIGGEPFDNYWGAGSTYTKISDISHTAGTFAFMEAADWRGYNVGTWVVEWLGRGGFEWETPPALWHGNVGSVGFADGHGELHKWTDPQIVDAGQRAAHGVEPASWSGPVTGTDYQFVYDGYRFPGHP